MIAKYIDEEMRNIVEADLRLAKDFIYDAARVKAHFQAHYEAFSVSSRKLIGLSSESFTGTMHNELDVTQKASRAADIFGHGCKIIMVVRNQSELLKSIYREWVIAGLYLTYRQFIEACVYNLRSVIWDLRFDKMLDLYSSLFGRENVLVLCFEELQAKPGPFLGRIAGHLGIRHCIHELPKENVRLTDQAVEYIRLRNRVRRFSLGRSVIEPANSWRYPGYFPGRFGVSESEITDKDARRMLWHLELAGSKIRTAIYGGTDYDLDPEMKGFLDRHYGEGNSKLAKATSLNLASFGYPLA